MVRWASRPVAAASLVGLALAWLLLAAPVASAAEGCVRCHQEAPRFSPFHDPQRIGCTSCHGGNAFATEKAAAHAGLEAYPGRVDTAAWSCGQATCHAKQVRDMQHSIMNTLTGMIELTRGVFGAEPEAGRGHSPTGRLAQSGVDSYLRKLCVSCHLGNERRGHGQSQRDRGGGCAACHLRSHAPSEGMGESATRAADAAESRQGIHPTLTMTVPDERCFGCHSRSSRVALNYVGLAEVDAPDPARPEAFGQLQDGRWVERLAPDLHSAAGMSCTDCHTAAEVMGTGQPVTRLDQQLDVGCEDCHAPTLYEKPLGQLTRRELIRPGLAGWTSPDLGRGVVVVTARRGSPLWNVYRRDGRRLLRAKASGKKLAIPVMRPGAAHDRKGHERLTCGACHDVWAPQCDGCHIAFDPDERQWDHLEHTETSGRWIERRWHIRNEAPALGVTSAGRIAPFVPGMSLVAELPGQSQRLRAIRYTRVVPHTTQRAGRDCASCHRSEQSLGVITGQAAAPWDPSLHLPVGWVRRDAAQPGHGLRAGERSLDRVERERVRRVGTCLGCHGAASRIYDDYRASLSMIARQRPHPDPKTRMPAP